MSYIFNGLADHFRPVFAANVTTAANKLRERYRQILSTPYPPASRPGESPHRRTGNLMNSIEVIGPADQGNVILASIGTAVPYGLFLELGTSRMAARPWLSRGLAEGQQEITETIAQGHMAVEEATA